MRPLYEESGGSFLIIDRNSSNSIKYRFFTTFNKIMVDKKGNNEGTEFCSFMWIYRGALVGDSFFHKKYSQAPNILQWKEIVKYQLGN